ncbi:hypothetical protein JK635_08230 [Neobacillus sp. YIM B02564]|uniref:IDEAL domain-containing protein n=1 Tax=Neobacillus paridis TaxID=2803862 RepID=A0ABS1TLM4_9BACI|nr:hypothetical protein [Neobacillus paridis]MBL4952195.1 hypothetical protein [Neobacillus paridis]
MKLTVVKTNDGYELFEKRNGKANIGDLVCVLPEIVFDEKRIDRALFSVKSVTDGFIETYQGDFQFSHHDYVLVGKRVVINNPYTDWILRLLNADRFTGFKSFQTVNLLFKWAVVLQERAVNLNELHKDILKRGKKAQEELFSILDDMLSDCVE